MLTLTQTKCTKQSVNKKDTGLEVDGTRVLVTSADPFKNPAWGFGSLPRYTIRVWKEHAERGGGERKVLVTARPGKTSNRTLVSVFDHEVSCRRQLEQGPYIRTLTHLVGGLAPALNTTLPAPSILSACPQLRVQHHISPDAAEKHRRARGRRQMPFLSSRVGR